MRTTVAHSNRLSDCQSVKPSITITLKLADHLACGSAHATSCAALLLRHESHASVKGDSVHWFDLNDNMKAFFMSVKDDFSLYNCIYITVNPENFVLMKFLLFLYRYLVVLK